MLKPDYIYYANGVKVNVKIIPDGTRWKDNAKARACKFKAGDLYKAQRKLNGTGYATSTTAHNTPAYASVSDNAELYTRATYYENMGAARVQFYVDDKSAWQNLKAGTGMCPTDKVGSAEVGYHAGDTTVPDGGNNTSIGIEIIMGASPARDKKAQDNAARLIAWLLWKNNLDCDKLFSHTYWVNHKAGKHFADVDVQCTSPISDLKWCPYYIFGSTNPTTALKNWKAFKGQVRKYLDALTCKKTQIPTAEEKPPVTAEKPLITEKPLAVKDEKPLSTESNKQLSVGDKVKLKENSPVYGTNKRFLSFVYKSTLYVRSINGNRVVVSVLPEGAITGAVDKKYIQSVQPRSTVSMQKI